MTGLAIRKKLVSYLQVAEEKKVKAVYALLQDDIEEKEWEYSVALKKQLDEGAAYYKNGGKMISAAEATREVNKIVKSKKN
jgi:hypothetical protein